MNVEDNAISDVSSDYSAKGIYIGDSSSSNRSMNIVITGNEIDGVTSAVKGAYGITTNNGAATAGGSTFQISGQHDLGAERPLGACHRASRAQRQQ